MTTTTDALHDNARIAIPLGIALIVGVFVSLGIEGDLLARLLRNSPGMVALSMGGAVVGVTAPLVMAWTRPEVLKWVASFSAVLLVVSTIFAILVGTRALGIREQPNLDISGVAADPEKHTVILKASASALSLASDNRMILRIAAFSTATTPAKALDACQRWSPSKDPNAQVLYWGETGPSAGGTAETSHTFSVDTSRSRIVCALVELNVKAGERDGRKSAAIFDAASAATSETR